MPTTVTSSEKGKSQNVCRPSTASEQFCSPARSFKNTYRSGRLYLKYVDIKESLQTLIYKLDRIAAAFSASSFSPPMACTDSHRGLCPHELARVQVRLKMQHREGGSCRRFNPYLSLPLYHLTFLLPSASVSLFPRLESHSPLSHLPHTPFHRCTDIMKLYNAFCIWQDLPFTFWTGLKPTLGDIFKQLSLLLSPTALAHVFMAHLWAVVGEGLDEGHRETKQNIITRNASGVVLDIGAGISHTLPLSSTILSDPHI